MPSRESTTKETPHFTTRRGFVAAAGFGGVTLYGLWAAYGAAPGPLALLGLAGGHDEAGVGDAAGAHDAGGAHGDGAQQDNATGADAGGHGGHGGAAAPADAEAFRRTTEEFIERHRLPDGTVYPRRQAAPAVSEHGAPAGHAEGMAMADEGGPIEIPMVAGRWYYLPAKLRLDAGETYRLRMLAVDVSHGASIQLGRGGRMARLRPGRETQLELSFRERGRYFMYCTVYCGAAHERMQAAIEVV